MTMNQITAEPVRRATAGRYRAELLPRQAYEAAYSPGYPVIGFAFEGQAGIHAFATDRRTAFRTRPNSLAFVPAGCDVYSQSQEGGEYLTITVLPGKAFPEGLGQQRFNDVVESAATAAAHDLRRWLLGGWPCDPLIVEHHALVLTTSIASVVNGRLCEPRLATWMTTRRRRIVEALIEERLEGPLTLDDLGGAVGLSADFFARAFKAAMGKPPHAYVIDCRIARARALLRSGEADLSAIACACGFASHAHMTAMFRRRLGVTPSALRAAGG
jgi:AraC family transcriptional regulator